MTDRPRTETLRELKESLVSLVGDQLVKMVLKIDGEMKSIDTDIFAKENTIKENEIKSK